MADDTEPRRLTRATAAEVAAWGQLLLRASAAAGRNNRSGEAASLLRFASAAAAVVGAEGPAPGDPLRRSFGPATVARKEGEQASVEGKPDHVLTIAETVPQHASTGHRRHRLDVAHAYALMRRPAEAVAELAELHAASPEWFVQQRYAADVLRLVLHRRRTFTPSMRELAGVLRVA